MVSPKPKEKIWVYPKINAQLSNTLARELFIHPIVAQVLVSREITDSAEIQSFFYSKLPDLHNPFLFNEMKQAVQRIDQAMQAKEAILIYGDNDVDGMTGAALLYEFFKDCGSSVQFFAPNRSQNTQNILLDALDFAIEKKCKLMITVDCGITAAKEIKEVVSRGVDVIVTDHHEPTAPLPHCVATLNPKLVNSTYPDRNLTGVGVAFKLAHAMHTHFVRMKSKISEKIHLKSYLDFVALGTIADMGVLTGENRIFVRYGLKQLWTNQRDGLQELFKVCDVSLEDATTSDIASKIAPRLNSLGRIADPRKGIELLLIRDDLEKAKKLAEELDLNNAERQRIEQEMVQDIEIFLKEHPEITKKKAIVLHSEKWHPGIIPIITARITKTYNRPTVIIACENGVGKGSVRTIQEFPLLPALKALSPMLINFGGHDFAAGLTIKDSNIEKFKKEFSKIANKTLEDQDMIFKLHLDTQANFEDITFDLIDSLSLLTPYGNANPPPQFYCDVTQVWTPKILGKHHLKLFLEQKGRFLEGIAFGLASRCDELRRKGLKLRIIFTPQVNNFQNKLSIHLLVKDFQVLEKK